MSSYSQPAGNNRGLPDGEALKQNITFRRRIGMLWRYTLFATLIFGLFALLVLGYRIADDAFGTVAIESVLDPSVLGDRDPDDLAREEAIALIEEYASPATLRRLNRIEPLGERPDSELIDLVKEEVLRERVVQSWSLTQTLFNRDEITTEAAELGENVRLEFYSWINADFLSSPMSSTPALAGVRTAILGSIWMVAITILIAFPLGIGAAIYLEEYATDSWINRIIRTNINNLAGVPSIIYGMLGLAIFVRAFEPFTSGQLFGLGSGSDNGRTILSAGLTLALLVLPIVIINSQEAIRAVPGSLRQASYGLGATKWQTVWNHVLPQALPGILTGTIFALSRALGETAPLIVVGASTFITTDPDSVFSKFTVLPIQIYEWTKQPQDQFRDIAAAAIVVLLIVLLALNATAVLLRNRYSKRI